jgi:oxaloacetate decarboxylase beta subunit
MQDLFQNIINMNWDLFPKQLAMWAIGGILIFLAIKKKMEPTLLLPMGFGAILMNIPNNTGSAGVSEVLKTLYEAGIANELFPLILFIGIGAMIDFGPILSNPKLMIFGAAAQFGIFMTLSLASMFFNMPEAASIAIIGAADGPTSIVVAGELAPQLLGPITVAAYSYMALVPVIQRPIMLMLTTKKERLIRMKAPRAVSQKEKIIFPIVGFILTALIVPSGMPLLGMLFFGNLLKESGVTKRLAETARGPLIDVVTILIGVTVGCSTQADVFLTGTSIKIFFLGLLSFIIATACGVLFTKFMNLFCKEGNKINPLIGNAGVSAVPDAARVSQNVGREFDKNNHLLMHAMAPNVAGVIGSAVAAGILLSFLG